MFDPRTALAELRNYVSQLEPAQVTTERAAELVGVFAEIEHVAVGAKLTLVARAAEGTTWVRAGHRSAASWLADVTGTGMSEAMSALETADRLTQLPKTAEAVRRGELSAGQAREIAAAGAANPAAESELLDAADTDSFKQLKDRARRIRATAASQRTQAEREAQIHRTRFVRRWTDDDGAFRLEAKVTTVNGAHVMAALEARARRFFEEARDAGTRETEAAYLADALVALCCESAAATGGKPAKGTAVRPAANVNLRVDLAALRRGAVQPDEKCEIPGVGPVSLATARSLLGDCFLKLFVTDGIDVQSLVHYGRTIRAPIRSALEERDPCCVVPGCGATRFLQIDHWQIDFADDGPSALWNLARLCPHHHHLKTRGDYELAGGPGKWEFRPVVSPARPPPGKSPPRSARTGRQAGESDDPRLDGL